MHAPPILEQRRLLTVLHLSTLLFVSRTCIRCIRMIGVTRIAFAVFYCLQPARIYTRDINIQEAKLK